MTHNQIINAAKQYLKERNPEVKKCFLNDWRIRQHWSKGFLVDVELAYNESVYTVGVQCDLALNKLSEEFD